MSGMRWDGSVQSSAGVRDRTETGHRFMNGLALGVVLFVRPPDHPDNKSCEDSAVVRGSHHEAVVWLVHGLEGAESQRLDHVIICPESPSDMDDFSEDLPRGCMQLTDLGALDSPGFVAPEQLDGEFCVIAFLGNSLDAPFVLKWWPHPANRFDPATSGEDGETLDQQGRTWRRKGGTRWCFTPEGSLFADFQEAGSFVTPTQGGARERKRRLAGGDVQLDAKPGRTVEVNYNPVVARPDEPAIAQQNPPAPGAAPERADTLTRFTLTEDFVEAVAGKVAKLFARAGSDGVWLGGTPEEYESNPSAWDRIPYGSKVLGAVNRIQVRLNALAKAFREHTGHVSSPSGLPLNVGSVQGDVDGMEQADLTEHARVR